QRDRLRDQAEHERHYRLAGLGVLPLGTRRELRVRLLGRLLFGPGPSHFVRGLPRQGPASLGLRRRLVFLGPVRRSLLLQQFHLGLIFFVLRRFFGLAQRLLGLGQRLIGLAQRLLGDVRCLLGLG